MTKMRIVALVVLVSGVCCAVSAMAGEGEDKGPGKRERGKDHAEHFKASDTDDSGGLSVTEFTAMHEKRRAMMKKKLGDRYDAERAAKMPTPDKIFAKIDTDNSGEISQEEMGAAHKRRGKHGPRKGKGGEAKQ